MRELENSKIPEQIEKGFMEDVGNHADAVHHHHIAKVNELSKTRNETIANLIQTGVSRVLMIIYKWCIYLLLKEHIARTHNIYHVIKKEESTGPQKIFLGEDDGILRHWHELLRLAIDTI